MIPKNENVLLIRSNRFSPTPLKKYNLNIINGDGDGTYEKYTDVYINGNLNYPFVQWSGDISTVVDIYSEATTAQVTGDMTLSAIYNIPFSYSLIIHDGYGNGVYDSGEIVNIYGSLDDTFYTWSGDVANVANISAENTTVEMNSDTELSAIYIPGYTTNMLEYDGEQS
jgi:hypothetical protein